MSPKVPEKIKTKRSAEFAELRIFDNTSIKKNNLVTQKNNYRPDIDGLRAIAVISVVVFHAFPDFLPGGFIGVDIFFVISGFLITGILLNDLEKTRFNLYEFYGRRIRRIFPALILVLLTCLVIGWFVFLPEAYEELGRQVVAGCLFASNFLFWREAGYFDAGADTKTLLHLWSLGVEEQFYILWPILIYGAYRFRWKILPIISAVLITSLVVNIACVGRWQTATFYLPFSRLWELALGGSLAYWSLISLRTDGLWSQLLICPSFRNLRHCASVLGCALILTAIFMFDHYAAYPGWRPILPTLGAALLIFAGKEGLINKALLVRRALVFVGLISYPLYMWHWPLLSLLRTISSKNPTNAAIWVTVIASIILASLTYVFLEKPIRHIRYITNRTKVARVLALIMASIGCVGIIGIATKGASFRVPAAIRFLDTRTVDHQWMVDNWRDDSCFLERIGSSFSPLCIDKTPQDAPLLVIWGDSHAASLYPGLRELQKDHAFRLGQLTKGTCPPILNFDDPESLHANDNAECVSDNEKTFELIKALKPNTVVLEAYWWRYAVSSHWQETIDKLNNTITLLNKAGIENIILMGTLPVWPKTLKKVIRDSWISDPLHRIPIRTHIGLADNLPQIDENLQALAINEKIMFLSPRKFLCDSEGCLVRLGDSVDDLLTWDDAHLTPHAAHYLIDMAAPTFLYNHRNKE